MDRLAVVTACYRAVILLAVSCVMLRADLTLKIRTATGAGQTTESTEYYKGDLMRRDLANGYQVVDFSTGRSFSVDLEKKEYYPTDGAKMKQEVDSSHKIFVETTCFATGEQRPWFGYTATHYLTTKKWHDERNGQSSGFRETHFDTWMLDWPVPPHVEGIASPNANFFVSVGMAGGVTKVPDFKTTHNGPVPHGLVVRLKTEQYESEVVALSQAPLDESIFEVPKGFREGKPRTVQPRALPLTDQIRLEWLRFLAWVGI